MHTTAPLHASQQTMLFAFCCVFFSLFRQYPKSAGPDSTQKGIFKSMGTSYRHTTKFLHPSPLTLARLLSHPCFCVSQQLSVAFVFLLSACVSGIIIIAASGLHRIVPRLCLTFSGSAWPSMPFVWDTRRREPTISLEDAEHQMSVPLWSPWYFLAAHPNSLEITRKIQQSITQWLRFLDHVRVLCSLLSGCYCSRSSFSIPQPLDSSASCILTHSHAHIDTSFTASTPPQPLPESSGWFPICSLYCSLAPESSRN